MSAPLEILEFTGWDYMLAGDVANIVQQGATRWTGSVGSMQTGWNGTGQCIRNPNNLDYAWPNAARYRSIYVHLRIRQTVALAASPIFALLTSTNSTVLTVGLDSTGHIYIGNLPELGKAAAPIVLGQWHEFECLVFLDESVSPVGKTMARLDRKEIPELTLTGVKTDQYSFGDLNKIRLDSSANLDFDDFVLKCGFEDIQVGDFMSGCQVIRRTVSGNGSALGTWQKSAGTDPFYEYVNEAQGNGATDYVFSATPLDEIRFNLFNVLGTEASEVVDGGVRVVMQARTTSSTSVGIEHRIVQPTGSDLILTHPETHAAFDKTVGFRFLHYPWPYDPEKFLPWTKDSLSDMEVCIRRSSYAGAGEVRVSQILFEAIVYVPETSAEYVPDDISIKSTFRDAVCYEIKRTDGVQIFITSANEPLVIDGKTYTPMAGIVPSAERVDGSLRDSNQEFVGALTSDLVTEEDLRLGRYRKAEVLSFHVDWLMPWTGRRRVQRFFVGETRQNGQIWEAEIAGISRFLRRKIGSVVSRTCRNSQLGAGTCHYPAWFYTIPACGIASVVSDLKFRLNSTDMPSKADDYLNHGWVRWRSGENWGLFGTIRDYTNSTREVTLFLPMPADIATTDYVDVGIGCDFSQAKCDEYEQLQFFNGELWTPGTSKMLDTPQE